MEQSRLDRINELARKAKGVGLSDQELTEQKKLREEYLAIVRQNLRGTLEKTTVQFPDGTKKKLQKGK